MAELITLRPVGPGEAVWNGEARKQKGDEGPRGVEDARSEGANSKIETRSVKEGAAQRC